MTESSYLVDTNVWLERLLGQQKSDEVGRFLDVVPTDRMCLTDFAFHSISLIMVRLGKKEGLLKFVRDAFIDGAMTITRLEPVDMENLVRVMEHFRLDFDDAYQYVTAEKFNLTLVSFDTDFDRTERGRKTPADLLKT